MKKIPNKLLVFIIFLFVHIFPRGAFCIEHVQMELMEGQITSGAIYLPCNFDGNERKCFLDTGSNSSNITEDVFSLTYPAMRQVEYTGASGTIEKKDIILIKNLSVGPFILNETEIGRIPNLNSVIGSNFFANISLFFDFEHKALSLSDSSPDPAKEYDLISLGGVPAIHTFYEKETLLSAWDTGAGLTTVDENYVNSHKDAFSYVADVPGGKDVTETPVILKLYKMKKLSIGNLFAEDFYILAMNFDFIHEHVDPNLKLIIGYNLITTYNWYIDYFRKKWVVTPFSKDNSIQWITPDFFIQKTINSEQKQLHAPLVEYGQDCRARISDIVCLVDPQEESKIGELRKCLEGGEVYENPIEKLYDSFPQVLQKMFCSLDVIYIEKDFSGTAYAGVVRNEKDEIVGAKLGIRKSLLDEPISLSLWASWKEQLSFGGVRDSFSLTPGLPIISITTDLVFNDLLYFVIAHEFGHIFDFTNWINREINCQHASPENPVPECNMAPGSFGSISWETNIKPREQNEFQNRDKLCFYWCGETGGPLSKDVIPQLYQGLHKSEFISIYATTSPWEDFADSLAYLLLDKDLKGSYLIDTGQGKTFNAIEKLHSKIFQEKKEYIEKFLGSEIIYP